MKIVVVGCGKVGQAVVEQLNQEGHDITVIDSKPERVRKLTGSTDVLGIAGNGVSFQTLIEADIAHTDLLVSVTGSDEQNLLCCMIAKKTGNCKTIALVRNPIYNEEINYLKNELGIAMVINPELAAAAEIARMFRFPFANKIDSFAKGRVELVHFHVRAGSMLAGKTLKQIRSELHYEVLICLVKRNSEVIIPGGDFRILADDTIAFVADASHINRFFRKIGLESYRVHNTMLLGGGKISYYLAKKLSESGIHVKIIEYNKDRCEELSDLLPKATIICGDATDQSLLLEEGLETADGVASLTGMDEENILLSLFANENCRGKTITKVNRINFSNVIGRLSLGSVIYPRYIVADYILRYARSMKGSLNSNMETLYILEDGKAEAIEFYIKEASAVVGIPLETLRIRKNILLCCIIRGGKTIIPSGQDTIQIHDSVVIVLKDYKIKNIIEILEG